MNKFPKHLYNEWNSDANDKKLDDYSVGSKYRAHWVCSNNSNHKWESRVSHRVNGTRCPYCTNRILVVGENDLAYKFPDIAKEWSSTNAMQPEDVVFGYAKKVSWECEEGHEWEDTVSNRTLLGRGCPYCVGAKPVKGVNDLATLYPDVAKQWSAKNNYKPEDVLPQSNRKPIWVCADGHEWETSIAHRTKGGTNCPYCANQKVMTGFNDFATTHKDSHLLKEWSSKNIIKPKELTAGSIQRITWICKLKHEWDVSISERLRGTGCPYCVNKTVLTGFNDLQTTHPDLVKEWSPKNKLKPSEVLGAKDEPMWWKCDKGHEWQSNIYARKQGKGGCPNCNAGTSKPEKEIAEFLEQYSFTVKRNDRKVLKGLKGLELDFYIPEKNIAIEFNGLYWHTEARGKDKSYHYNKWVECRNRGIQLIQIWEDDWNRNPEIVKNMLANKLGVSQQVTVYGRKTETAILSVEETRFFMNTNHIQGWSTGSHYIGLKDKVSGQIVAACILKKEAGTEGKTLNIIRYATSCKVQGGFTKLLKFAETAYLPEKIITFSDNTVSDGGLYLNNGFVAEAEIRPDYQYLVNGERKHKFGYRLEKFRTDPSLVWVEGYTESQLAALNGLERIWDAGKTRWVKNCATSDI